MKALIRLRSLLEREAFDLVHTHTSKGGFIGRIAAKMGKVKRIVHTVHGFAFHEFSAPLITIFYSTLERFASRFCDRLIFVNQKDCHTAEVLRIGKDWQRRVVYNGIDYEAIEKVSPHRKIKDELGIPDDGFVLSFTGRLSCQKNPRVLIESMPAILRDYPNTYLLLIGEDMGLKSQLMERMKDLGIEKNVKFLGFRRDCISIIKATDCFILPSLWEGLSISLLEAMACGLPCVVSDIKGNNEVIVDGENGLLFSPLSPSALAEKVKLVIKDRDFASSLAIAAKRTVKEKFSLEVFLEKTLEIYKELGIC